MTVRLIPCLIALVVTIAAIVAASCGPGVIWGKRPGQPSSFLYFGYFNGSPGQVVGYAIDPDSGGLTSVPGSPWTVPGPLHQLAVGANERIAFVPDEAGANIYAYAIEPGTGTLMNLPIGPIPGYTVPAMGRDATSLYLMGPLGITGYAIDPATRQANFGSTTAGSYRFIAIDPSSRYLAAVEAAGPGVSLYQVDGASGSISVLELSEGSAPTGAAARVPAFHPSGRYLYVPNFTSGQMYIYSIDDAAGLTYSMVVNLGPSGANTPAIDATGRFMYIPMGINGIQIHKINAADGSLTQIGALTPGPVARIALEPTGRFAYAVSGSNPGRFYSFSIDPSSGMLSLMSTSATNPFPYGAIVVTPH